jgi:hypothetical protein
MIWLIVPLLSIDVFLQVQYLGYHVFLIDLSMDWLIYWLIDCCRCCPWATMCSWLIYQWINDWFIDWLVYWLLQVLSLDYHVFLIDLSMDWLIDWLIVAGAVLGLPCVLDWFINGLIDLLIDCCRCCPWATECCSCPSWGGEVAPSTTCQTQMRGPTTPTNASLSQLEAAFVRTIIR